jgi:hypothetical protein
MVLAAHQETSRYCCLSRPSTNWMAVLEQTLSGLNRLGNAESSTVQMK